MDEERARRVGINEAVFRELNEQLAGLASEPGDLSCVCECGAISCVDSLVVTHDEYRALRADPTTFAIAHGHLQEGVEDVVARNERYEVVRKRPGLPAAIARETA